MDDRTARRAGATPARTLPEALVRAAERAPGRGVGLFDRRGREAGRRAWPEVLGAARRGAGRLARAGVGAGDRVGVCLPTSWEWFEAWLGALVLGARPLALAPPGPMGAPEATVARLDRLTGRLGLARIVAPAALAADAGRLGARDLAAAAVAPEELAAGGEAPFTPAAPEPEETAYLQLTSGSTGDPRAVMVSHRAALHNVRASDAAIGAPWGGPASARVEAVVSWLPLYHDMGLVGCLLYSLAAGHDLWLFQPRNFLARPRGWLEQLGRRGAAIAPAPNFGYQLCLERVAGEEAAGLDLASWKAAMVGAEMIRPETMAGFLDAFGRAGFAAEAMRPCYGLAEATLAVTFDVEGRGVRTRPAPAGARVVAVGRPVADTELRIADPAGRPLPAEREGEVWVRGPGLMSGYLDDPGATAEALAGGWLRTGDLGLLAGGELYLTGRIKDILIIRGQNLMPHELEWLAERTAGGGGAARAGAFAVARGAEGEQAVVVLESESRAPEALAALDRAVRLAVAHALSLPLADLVLVRRGQIPKTTSGKVQRRELRRRYLAGELERLAAGGS